MNFIMNIDNGIISIMQNNVQNSFLDKIMPAITSIGGFEIWILIALTLICTKKYRKQGIVLVVALGVCIVLGSFCIKPLVKRIRPCDVYDYLNLITAKPTGYSFPSGHSMRSFAAAMVLFKTNKKFGIPAFIAAFLTAFSRVYLYAHYFTDAFVGAVLGMVCAVVVYNVLMKNTRVNRFLEKRCSLLWN